jgi:hypothetical protein
MSSKDHFEARGHLVRTFPHEIWIHRKHNSFVYIERTVGIFIVFRTTINQSITFIYKALFTSANVTKCYTEMQQRLTPNSNQCSTVPRKNSLEQQEPRKKPREEPGSEGWPVLVWLCRVEIIRVHRH